MTKTDEKPWASRKHRAAITVTGLWILASVAGIVILLVFGERYWPVLVALLVLMMVVSILVSDKTARWKTYYLPNIKPDNHFGLMVCVYVDPTREFASSEGNALRLKVPYLVMAYHPSTTPVIPQGKWVHYQTVRVADLDLEALKRGAVLVFNETQAIPENEVQGRIHAIYEKLKGGG